MAPLPELVALRHVACGRCGSRMRVAADLEFGEVECPRCAAAVPFAATRAGMETRVLGESEEPLATFEELCRWRDLAMTDAAVQSVQEPRRGPLGAWVGAVLLLALLGWSLVH